MASLYNRTAERKQFVFEEDIETIENPIKFSDVHFNQTPIMTNALNSGDQSFTEIECHKLLNKSKVSKIMTPKNEQSIL